MTKAEEILALAKDGLTASEISSRISVHPTYARQVVRKSGSRLPRPPSDKMIDVSGERFGCLTAISRQSGRRWLCLCDCGGEKIVPTGTLRAGLVISCGCRYQTGDQCRTHGMSKDGHYFVWMAMKERCFNPNSTAYKWYGARGIAVCERWRHSFENFLSDMGRRPADKHSIDRIDNDGDYEPGNCRWATWHEQARNRRPRGACLA